MQWNQSLKKSWKPPRSNGAAVALRNGIALVSKHKLAPKVSEKNVVAGQPFDRHLLAASGLYRKSRERYLKNGGEFRPRVLTAARALTSASLLKNYIEYSPLDSELEWAATDSIEQRKPEQLLELRKFISSIFHEQNHRILWSELPPPPRDTKGLTRYLNFAESLVITLDMALADELGHPVAQFFNLVGVIYDPGTEIKTLKLSKRNYRNYLQVCLQATYLNLCLYDTKDIAAGMRVLFPNMEPELVDRAVKRSSNLNRKFITQTNMVWQKKHQKEVLKTLSNKARASFVLPHHPLDNSAQYVFAERWFEGFGL